VRVSARSRRRPHARLPPRPAVQRQDVRVQARQGRGAPAVQQLPLWLLPARRHVPLPASQAPRGGTAADLRDCLCRRGARGRQRGRRRRRDWRRLGRRRLGGRRPRASPAAAAQPELAHGHVPFVCAQPDVLVRGLVQLRALGGRDAPQHCHSQLAVFQRVGRDSRHRGASPDAARSGCRRARRAQRRAAGAGGEDCSALHCSAGPLRRGPARLDRARRLARVVHEPHVAQGAARAAAPRRPSAVSLFHHASGHVGPAVSVD